MAGQGGLPDPGGQALGQVGGDSTTLQLSLTSKDSTTEWLAVPRNATNAAIDVQPDSAKTGTIWVADLEWSAEVGTDNEKPRAFNPIVQFNDAAPAQIRVPLPAGANIRLRTSTADGDSDPVAPVIVVLT